MLPTGRNFYSVDSRAVPTPAAWELGRKSAELLVTRYVQDHGDWPTSLGLTAWGTSNMRTGGDDIAQAMALIGAKPLWDHVSRRVTGYEIIPPAMLGRPRVDVTLRISGFFRDAFPDQIALYDKAVRERTGVVELRNDFARDLLLAGRTRDAVAQLDEARLIDEENPTAEALRAWAALESGDTAAARKHVAQALAWGPWSDLARAPARPRRRARARRPLG